MWIQEEKSKKYKVSITDDRDAHDASNSDDEPK
jgi:hypothetical protein